MKIFNDIRSYLYNRKQRKISDRFWRINHPLVANREATARKRRSDAGYKGEDTKERRLNAWDVS